MSLNHRQQHQLHRIESRLLRSDPRLGAILGVFARLTADQCMPAWEQIPSRRDRIRQAAAEIAQAIAVLAATVIVLIRAVVALITAPFSAHGSRPVAAGTERTHRGRETGDSQNPAGAG